ncbi:uncharacterized protein B0I36DRAFT_319744 [Microdochium trichocladiopsis]|uniref:Uncharacterized protein n=1 Tax=Microdochium trichocladiopsis TaxID=1682393 RepID=A0A9P9BRD9_9PEZI|nr:uncharacterized protein B0I36DRAFT_319744 [Microdochium trichocladiopsis]KAH7032623.1 hypothetical protein B0I36DRAFT_319744 [Microdochium trichocladiopsis]
MDFVQELKFPLVPDHQLITLVQYNAVRAILLNMSILSMLHVLPAGCPQSLGVRPASLPNTSQLPRDLHPTSLELERRSHPPKHQFNNNNTSEPPSSSSRKPATVSWFNIFAAIPIPQLRDNIILHAHRLDLDDLAHDLGKGVYDGLDDPERRGLVVWGDRPWSAHNWEASDGFVRKWGFLLEGCVDLVVSTNRWRGLRGDDVLLGGCVWKWGTGRSKALR